MAASDGLDWTLVAVAFILGVVVTIISMRLIGRVRRSPSGGAASPATLDADARGPDPFRAVPAAAPSLRDGPPAPAGTARDIQSRLLAVTAERLPAGCTALVICPPGDRLPIVWHVHLAASGVFAIPDGRTLPILPPPPTRQWTLPGGRAVRVAEGGTERQIASNSVTAQVTGPYVKVTLGADRSGAPRLIANAFGDPRGPSELACDSADPAIVEATIRQTVDLALSSRGAGSAPVLAYSRAAWDGHSRIWLAAADA